MTARQLAKACNLSLAVIRRIEEGKRPRDPAAIERIEGYLAVRSRKR